MPIRISPILLLALLPIFCSVTTAHTQSLGSPQPDLFLLSFDSLRADHLGSYGYDKPTSPAIDKLAQQGVVYEQYYAIRGLTGPALTTMLTGVSTPRHGILGHEPRSVSRHMTLLPEWLQDLGYRTVFFNANKMGKQVGLDLQGWDYTYFRMETDQVAEHAESFLRSKTKLSGTDQPLFCWVHFFYPHSPFLDFHPYTKQFDAPDDYWGPALGTQAYLNEVWAGERIFDERDFQRIMALYDATTRHADDLMGRIIEAIQQRSKRNPQRPTLICFTADHGEELADHGRFFFHARSVWKGSCHVPLILTGLDSLTPGTRVQRAVAQVDLMPTLLTILGLPVPPDLDGLYQPPTNEPALPSRAWGRQRITPIWWYRNERWTYLYHPFTEPQAYIPYPATGLFDRDSDAYEKVNLVGSAGLQVIEADLRAELEQLRHRGSPLRVAELLVQDQPPTPLPGFHAYILGDLPTWLFLEWQPIIPNTDETAQPLQLLAYSDQPFRQIDGDILATAFDQSAVLAGTGDSANRPGLLALELGENAAVTFECYHANAPAWERVRIGNRSQPEHAFSFTIRSEPTQP